MKWTIVIFIMKYLYKEVLRDLLFKVVYDPDSEWDEHLLVLCDHVFEYPEG